MGVLGLTGLGLAVEPGAAPEWAFHKLNLRLLVVRPRVWFQAAGLAGSESRSGYGLGPEIFSLDVCIVVLPDFSPKE